MIVNEELLNVMGSFSETALDCIEKQNEEIEDLKKENARLKEKIEKATNWVDKYMGKWDFFDEVRQDMNNLLILFKEN